MSISSADIYRVEIKPEFLNYKIDDVIKMTGYDACVLSDYLSDMIEEVFSLVPEKCEIRAGYRLIPVSDDNLQRGRFYIDNIILNPDKFVSEHMQDSEKVAVFVCTIGSDMETWSGQVFQIDPLKGYLIDTIASIVTEKAADYLHEFIGKEMLKENLYVTNRFSPGYCYWPVSEQHKLFKLLPENFCGIRLNASALMIPVKSVSGLIGIGHEVQFRTYPCAQCPDKDCIYRADNTKYLNV